MNDTTTSPSPGPALPPSRREFVRGAVTAAGAVAVAGAFPSRALAAGPSTVWSLIAENLQQNFADGSAIQIARYRPDAGGPTHGALPFLEAVEGTRVTLRIQNNTQVAIRPFITGVGPIGIILPGQFGGRRFRMPPAGTYMLKSHASDPVSEKVGLGSIIVSRPASGLPEIWPGGPVFDREYTLTYQDMDDRVNNDVQQLIRPDLDNFMPNFFMVNGLSAPDTTMDVDTSIACNVGERVLIRFANLGRMRHSIHFHGYHVEVLDRNNEIETHLPEKDTFGLPHAATVNAMLTPHQPGVYPLHPHSLTAVTANGLYPYGQLVLITAV